MDDKIKQLADIIKNSNNIVFFGGAGVSCASGIPDFRSSGGMFTSDLRTSLSDSTESNIPDFRSATGLFNEKLNRNFTPEQLVSHSFFFKHTEEFFKFYKDKLIYQNAKPNNAHIALAKLEKKGKLKGVITQNIDGLHQIAGSENVLELHGSIHRNYCISCGKSYDLCGLLSLYGIIPHCNECGSLVKPDVVLYEEGLNEDTINKSIELISNADVLIIGGTSLMVYLAAGFIKYFKGKHLILINKTKTQYDNMAELIIREPIGRVLEYCVLK